MSVKLYGQLMNFQNGLNVKDNPTLVADTELVEVFNADIGMGFVKKRNGYIVNVEGEVVDTMFLWSDIDDSTWQEIG